MCFTKTCAMISGGGIEKVIEKVRKGYKKGIGS